ncbi:MAG: hypE [Clostridiales bacterium]|nr:hypE [Clostridiales bacterium]
MNEVIKMVHGDGGTHTQQLIHQLFYKYFNNPLLLQGQDAADFSVEEGRLAFTTDSFVVKPLFFPGGNIGKLAVCGTINDLVVSGAQPRYLSSSFIIEEGFSRQLLEEIVKSMEEVCLESGVNIIAGDTKVVEKGSVDGVFINTSGIGTIIDNYRMKSIEAGDVIIVTGGIGEHGTIIAIELATVLHEFTSFCKLGIHLIEDQIPIKSGVSVVNNLLGLDPLYMACEGRMVIVVKESEAQKILKSIQTIDLGKDARIIGTFVEEQNSTIFMENYFGGKRIVSALEGSMLPRIC